jgi:uncharacterized surface protein with fasciclin (FAS1) repeats
LFRYLLQITGGVAVIVGSFWITLKALDYYEPPTVGECGLAQVGSFNSRVPPRNEVDVGGVPMLISRNIVQNVVQSKEHTMLYVALATAGLLEKLEATGPFTFFAPSNAAFKSLPAGQYEGLLTKPQRNELIRTLSYHVIPCKLTTAALIGLTEAGRSAVKLRTLEGEDLTVKQAAPSILTITDMKGGVSRIITPDVFQSNGIIHVVDAVLMPARSLQ